MWCRVFYLPVLSSRMQAAEAELLYIKEVEKLDGFGQETFPAKVQPLNTIYSHLGNKIVIIIIIFFFYFYSHTGQLHQWYFYWCVFHWRVCQTQKWQIYYAPQVSSACILSIFLPCLYSEPICDHFVWETKVNLCFCVRNRWKDIGTIAHNKSAITVEITSRDDTIIFHMVNVVSAPHINTLYTRLLVGSCIKKKCNYNYNS